MVELYNSFIGKTFLRSVWAGEYDVFVDSPHEASLLKRLRDWVDRKDLKETSAASEDSCGASLSQAIPNVRLDPLDCWLAMLPTSAMGQNRLFMTLADIVR